MTTDWSCQGVTFNHFASDGSCLNFGMGFWPYKGGRERRDQKRHLSLTFAPLGGLGVEGGYLGRLGFFDPLPGKGNGLRFQSLPGSRGNFRGRQPKPKGRPGGPFPRVGFKTHRFLKNVLPVDSDIFYFWRSGITQVWRLVPLINRVARESYPVARDENAYAAIPNDSCGVTPMDQGRGLTLPRVSWFPAETGHCRKSK